MEDIDPLGIKNALVFGGTMEQVKPFLNELGHGAIGITSQRDVIGRRGGALLLVGTWQYNKRAYEVVHAAMIAGMEIYTQTNGKIKLGLTELE